MAVANVEIKKVRYPMLRETIWWGLRKRFKQSIPPKVDGPYLSLVLGVEAASATKNLIPPLKKLGIIDEECKPTLRARRWRDDDEYPTVCEEIRKEIYPELAETLLEQYLSLSALEKWFQNKAGVGVAAAKNMASLYLLLCKADPTKQDSTNILTKPRSGKTTSTPPKISITKAKSARKSQPSMTDGASESNSLEEEMAPPAKYGVGRFQPALNINIEIHIPSDASPQQIDHIFDSMARHLFKEP